MGRNKQGRGLCREAAGMGCQRLEESVQSGCEGWGRIESLVQGVRARCLCRGSRLACWLEPEQGEERGYPSMGVAWCTVLYLKNDEKGSHTRGSLEAWCQSSSRMKRELSHVNEGSQRPSRVKMSV